jgi:intein-encoded DNA endonuclease-like protein
MEEIENKIKSLWDNGESIEKIAKQLGIKRWHAVKKIKELRESGKINFIERNKNKKISSKILNLWNNGVTNPYEIAKIVNTSKNVVYKSLTENNIKIERPKKNYRVRGKTKIENLSYKTKMILKEIENGKSKIEIAKKYGVSRQWVYSIEKVHIKGIKRKRYEK